MWMPIYNYVWTYGHVCNYYGDGTTQSNVLSEAEHCEEYHDFTAVFDYGHGSGKYEADPNTLHYGIYPDAPPEQSNPPNLIMDWETYPYTNDNHHFEFLWACGSGTKIGGFDSYGYPAGLPFGWTHKGNGSLSTDGYTDPWSSGGSYCFIGFENYSKPISEWVTPYTNRYKHWLVFFYYFMLIHNDVRHALDAASDAVHDGWDFRNMPFYNYYDYYNPQYPGVPWRSKIHVYGDGELVMP